VLNSFRIFNGPPPPSRGWTVTFTLGRDDAPFMTARFYLEDRNPQVLAVKNLVLGWSAHQMGWRFAALAAPRRAEEAPGAVPAAVAAHRPAR
jgi:hypothetical protein